MKWETTRAFLVLGFHFCLLSCGCRSGQFYCQPAPGDEANTGKEEIEIFIKFLRPLGSNVGPVFQAHRLKLESLHQRHFESIDGVVDGKGRFIPQASAQIDNTNETREILRWVVQQARTKKESFESDFPDIFHIEVEIKEGTFVRHFHRLPVDNRVANREESERRRGMGAFSWQDLVAVASIWLNLDPREITKFEHGIQTDF